MRAPVARIDSDSGPSADADALGFAAARGICRRHVRGIYAASFFLPPEKRRAAYSIHAFCRMMDEALGAGDAAADSASTLRELPLVSSRGGLVEVGAREADTVSSCCGTGSLDTRLSLLRDRLDEVYDDRLELPLPAGRSEAQHALHAFGVTVRGYGIPRQHFLDLAEGLRSDLAVRRYATWASLERHCYHTVGVLALIHCGVLGVNSSDAARHAVLLGNAMRLTDILSNLGEDWTRARLYLPLEDLARFRYSERDLAAGLVSDNFRALIAFEIERARAMFREGAAGLRWIPDDGSRLFAAAVAVIHAGILDEIERQGFDVFSRRVKLSTAEKLARFPRAWRLARLRDGESVPARIFDR